MHKLSVLLIGLVLVSTACASTATAPLSATVPTVAPSAPTAAVPTTSKADPLSPYLEALDQTLAAASYRFAATVQAQTQSGMISVDLTGWVNGADRQLVTTSGGRQTTTTVKDGVATVTTPTATTEVPLTEAAAAPSLLLLRDLQEPGVVGVGEVTGTLSQAVLAGSGLSDGSAAGTVTDASITYEPGGTLTGYTLTDGAHTWTMTVRIYDVGQVGA